MSHYKLTYFNSRGRAELCRLIFAVAGVQYEDVRLEKDHWPALKPKAPFGQLPMLEVDGVTLCQSNAMARFLARRFNLAGKTELDQARVDMIIDCFEDSAKPLMSLFHEPDEQKKAELKKKFVEEQLPVAFVNLEKLLVQNHNGDKYLVGDELTWADLALIILADWLTHVGGDAEFGKHPKLAALRQRVLDQPKIAEWIAKRPVTQM